MTGWENLACAAPAALLLAWGWVHRQRVLRAWRWLLASVPLVTRLRLRWWRLRHVARPLDGDRLNFGEFREFFCLAASLQDKARIERGARHEAEHRAAMEAEW